MSCVGAPLNEPVSIQDDFISGVDHIETVAENCARFVLYVEQTAPPHGAERTTIRKIVIPHHCLAKAVRKTLRYMVLHQIELGMQLVNRMLS